MANTVTIDAKLNETGVVSGAKKVKVSLEDIKKADGSLNWEGVEEGKEALNTTADSANGLNDNLGTLSDLLGELGGAATLAAGIGVFAAYANESSEASARLSAALAGTGKDVESFDKAMQNIYAQNYGESFEDIADAASQVIQIVGQDINPAALESITKSAIVLRDTFGIDIPESTKAAQVMMDNFGMTSEQAFDMIAKGAQEGLNINGDMLDAFSEYSPYFKQLGLDATDMFNAFASGADISMYGVDKAGDAFKEFGIRVVDGSESTKAAFAAIGLSADEYAAKIMEGGDTAKQATTEIINGLLAIEDPVERNMQGVALFGTQWEDLGQDGAEAMLSLMGQAVECEGTLSAIDDVRYNSLGGCIGEIGRAFEVSLLQPLVDAIMPALSGFAQWFTDNQGVIVPIVGGIAAAFGILAASMSIQGLIRGVTAAFGALNAVMSMNPVTLVVALIAGLAVAFVTLWNNCEEFRNFWLGLWESIQAAVQPIADWVLANVVTPLMGHFQEFQSAFSELWNAIVANVTSAWEQIAPIVQFGMEMIQTIFGALMPVIEATWSAAWGIIQAIATAVWNVISSTVTTVMGIIQGVIQVVTGIISGDWNAVWNGIKQIFESVINGILQAGANIFNALAQIIGSVLVGIYNVWASIWNSVFSTVRSVWSSITSAISGAVSAVWNNITGTFNALVSTVSGIFNALQNAITHPVETAKNILKGIIDAIRGFFNFKIKWPHIPMPHFSINPPGWQIGDLLQGKIPSLGLDWYATGGMFNGPSVIGVGEAGTEFVVPRDGRHMQPFAQAVSENMSFPSPEEFAAAIVAALMAAGFGKTVLTIDGKTLGEALAPYLDQINGNRFSNAKRGLAL